MKPSQIALEKRGRRNRRRPIEPQHPRPGHAASRRRVPVTLACRTVAPYSAPGKTHVVKITDKPNAPPAPERYDRVWFSLATACARERTCSFS
jgi:hypothetical protein